jgi:aspartyl-tRNA(Asn)/glutamyl-tRNA(Gln) amidotransferase subunit B
MPSEVAERLQLFAFSSSKSSTSSFAVSLMTELETLCLEAISTLPEEAIAMYKGNKNVVNRLVGWVMKKSRGWADAMVAKEVLERMNLR